MTRGTSNANVRGNTATRRRRRQWLVDNFRADVSLVTIYFADARPPAEYASDFFFEVFTVEELEAASHIEAVTAEEACRCYRCGALLTVNTVTVDRRVPGCAGGKYTDDNIRPACMPCNESTGGYLGAQRKKEKKDGLADR